MSVYELDLQIMLNGRKGGIIFIFMIFKGMFHVLYSNNNYTDRGLAFQQLGIIDVDYLVIKKELRLRN